MDMSLTMDTYEQNNIYAEYRWDKYAPHWEVIVGVKMNDGLVHTLWTKCYGTMEQAKRSFKRRVAKIKKGELL